MNKKTNNNANLILIVEDSITVSKGLANLLKKNGYNIVTAENGLEAVAVFKKGLDVDLVLMDIEMPKMDGITACLKIRDEYNDRYIPIIMLTALDSKVDLLKGFAAGAADYISKNASHEELLARVRSNIRARNYFVEMQKAQRKLEKMGKNIASMKTASELNDAVGEKLCNINNIVKEEGCAEAVNSEVDSIYKVMNSLLGKLSEEYSRCVEDIHGNI